MKRNYVQDKRGGQSRVVTKRSFSTNLRPCLICLTAENETVNQAILNSESFIVGFNNRASKKIYNQRSHLISTFPHYYTNILKV